MKKIIFIFLLLCAGLMTEAQQDPIVSQYMFNGLLLNPAYAGTKPYVRTNLLHRSQWVGWKGAPMTDVATVDGRLKDKVSALGLIVSNDRVGITNQTDVYANYAYHIPLKPGVALSLGVKGGLSWYSARVGSLTSWDANDNQYAQGTQNSFLPNFGAGAFFYTKKFYAGISVPQILSYDPKEIFSIGKEVSTVPKVKRHYYLTAGYAFVVSQAWSLNHLFL